MLLDILKYWTESVGTFCGCSLVFMMVVFGVYLCLDSIGKDLALSVKFWTEAKYGKPPRKDSTCDKECDCIRCNGH